MKVYIPSRDDEGHDLGIVGDFDSGVAITFGRENEGWVPLYSFEIGKEFNPVALPNCFVPMQEDLDGLESIYNVT